MTGVRNRVTGIAVSLEDKTGSHSYFSETVSEAIRRRRDLLEPRFAVRVLLSRKHHPVLRMIFFTPSESS